MHWTVREFVMRPLISVAQAARSRVSAAIPLRPAGQGEIKREAPGGPRRPGARRGLRLAGGAAALIAAGGAVAQEPPRASVEQVIAEVARSVREDKMPIDDTGLHRELDPQIKAALLTHGAAFEALIDAAREWDARQP
jgi:hypothetical protein